MKYVSLCISLGITGFIFLMSSSTGAESASLSNQVAEVIQRLLANIMPMADIDILVLHTIVRKSAHLFEYFLLGITYTFTFQTFKLPFWSLILSGLIIAMIDEGLQYLPSERGPSIIDIIFFDYPGYLVGVFITKTIFRNIFFKINVS
ncbi:MAG: VanZ family protein [Candidatus Izemoplasmatales bacterium]|nr:VanZ family protein [Candidatus Izemoplasmatales bacterium]MDD4595338.1 VanZ family protein [Candidatus Izemoplasmatales bacterium]